MSNPLVSLVIPAYNVESLLPLTLDSVLAQTLQNFECIIVDDYSTDRTKSVIQKYAKKDKRLKLVAHRANGGLSAARNTGLRFAKGKYIAFLDSDDLLMPESLILRAQTLEKDSSEKVIGTYSGSLAITMDCKVAPKGKEVKLKVIDFITAGGNCPFNANQPMFKTALFRQFGGFDHSLKQAEDYDMWMRILRYGFRIVPTNLQLVTYRQTEGSMIKKNPLLHLDISYQRYTACFKPYPIECWNPKFENVLQYGLETYISELNICNRVLEFTGLSIAKNDSDSEILDRLCKYLPNYFLLIESHRPFVSQVKKGIDRYFSKNVNISSLEFQHIRLKIEKLYNNFKSRSKTCISENIEIKNKPFNKDSIVSSPAIQANIDLIFIPHKDYHVHSIYLLEPYLSSLGVSFIIVDISMHYRDEGVANACEKYDLPSIGYSNFILGNFLPKALVVFNDWDPIVNSIVRIAKNNSIPTIGIVEGIQDYLDADTKQDRKAYRTVEHLFLPGEYDKKYFVNSAQKIYIGGIPRIYEMAKSTENKINFKNKVALINSNFSYGVLEEHRDFWLSSAVQACIDAGFTPVISRHPADKGELYPEFTTNQSFYKALNDCTVLISRFASGILEAMAVKKPVIYFNPHNEKVDKFKYTKGAYPLVISQRDLIDSLQQLSIDYQSYAKSFYSFLDNHCSIQENPSKVISDRIQKILQKSKASSDIKYFFRDFQMLDQKSGSFNNIKTLKIEQETINNNLLFKKNKPESSMSVATQLIVEKKYEDAQAVYSQLLTIDPYNPAYKMGLNITKKLLELYKIQT